MTFPEQFPEITKFFVVLWKIFLGIVIFILALLVLAVAIVAWTDPWMAMAILFLVGLTCTVVTGAYKGTLNVVEKIKP